MKNPNYTKRLCFCVNRVSNNARKLCMYLVRAFELDKASRILPMSKGAYIEFGTSRYGVGTVSVWASGIPIGRS